MKLVIVELIMGNLQIAYKYILQNNQIDRVTCNGIGADLERVS